MKSFEDEFWTEVRNEANKEPHCYMSERYGYLGAADAVVQRVSQQMLDSGDPSVEVERYKALCQEIIARRTAGMSNYSGD